MEIYNQLTDIEKETLLNYICNDKIDDRCNGNDVICKFYCYLCRVIIVESYDPNNLDNSYESCVNCHKTFCNGCISINQYKVKKKSDQIFNEKNVCINCRN